MSTTPMMAQYLGIKEGYPNALLFYRMGDFYELFFEDALAASEALGIALTKRGKHQGQDIPMCGVPAHSAENYLLELIRSGFRVAIAEQMEEPAEARKRGSKAVVAREVVRLVTPGTLTEDALLEPRLTNWLAAFSRYRGSAALALADLSTGDLRLIPMPEIRLGPELARFAPREVLLADSEENRQGDIIAETGAALSLLPDQEFSAEKGRAALTRIFGVKETDGLGAVDEAGLSALGAILSYIELTQCEARARLKLPKLEDPSRFMVIDAATRRSLELSKTISGDRKGSLLGAIDRSVTAAGGRLLAERVASPSRNRDTIIERLDAIDAFIRRPELRDKLRDMLRSIPDPERALSRLGLGRASPRDLGALRDGLRIAEMIAPLLEDAALPALISEASERLILETGLASALDEALSEALPVQLADGGMVRAGYSSKLDEARALRDQGRGVIGAMQSRYAEETGISSLKIRHNAVLGYFVESTATHAERMLAAPLSDVFRHRQTTANALRFSTEELSQLESRILNASSEALEEEKRIFAELSERVLAEADEISAAANALAELDVAAGLAEMAVSESWCRPEIREDCGLKIMGGRHPVVEQAVLREGGSFIANDCQLEEGGIWLLTGPNMAGKSTFLRQNALIAILAQAGSYVPADRAEIGLVSQVFSRVGASDELARGRSTFMVEMVETAAILNQADEHALVILDEIGRGTATWDGLSIAWAVLEYLHEVSHCRALFATHYHELTSLQSRLDRLDNATMSVREHRGDVVFLHEVRKGAADRSYGVQVAKLAGLPPVATKRAKEILQALEAGDRQRGEAPVALVDDLPLFSHREEEPSLAENSRPVLEALEAVDPDTLSPRAALEKLYELRALLK